ncbi:putative solube lytic murein transglycosylase, SLT domain protein [Pasteurella multocida]|nr:putative solube lytic murein transglycosylase, SLT domain protein [Pasteurella multocida]
MKLTKIALTYLLTLMSMSLAAASVSVPEDKTQPTEASLTTTNLVQARQIYQKNTSITAAFTIRKHATDCASPISKN